MNEFNKSVNITLLANLLKYTSDIDNNSNLSEYSAKYISNTELRKDLKYEMEITNENKDNFIIFLNYIYNPIINNYMLINNDNTINSLRLNYLNEINDNNYEFNLNTNIVKNLLDSISFITYGNNPTEDEKKNIEKYALYFELKKKNEPNIYEKHILIPAGIILNVSDYPNINPLKKTTNDNKLDNFHQFINIQLNKPNRRNEFNSSKLKKELTISFIISSINFELFNDLLSNNKYNFKDNFINIIENQNIIKLYENIKITNIIPPKINELIKEKKIEFDNSLKDISNKNNEYNKSAENLKNNLKDILKNNYIDKSLPISDIYYDNYEIPIDPDENTNNNPILAPIRNAANAISANAKTINNPNLKQIITYNNSVTKIITNINIPTISNKSEEPIKAMIDFKYNPGNPPIVNPAVPPVPPFIFNNPIYPEVTQTEWISEHKKTQDAATNIDNDIIFPLTVFTKGKKDAIAIQQPLDLISSNLSKITLMTAEKVLTNLNQNNQVIPVLSSPTTPPPNLPTDLEIAVANNNAIKTIQTKISNRIDDVINNAAPSVAAAAINAAIAAAILTLEINNNNNINKIMKDLIMIITNINIQYVHMPVRFRLFNPLININNFISNISIVGRIGNGYYKIDNYYDNIITSVYNQSQVKPIPNGQRNNLPGRAAGIISYINYAVKQINKEDLVGITTKYIKRIANTIRGNENIIYAAAANAAILVLNNASTALTAVPSTNTRAKEVTEKFVNEINKASRELINNIIEILKIKKITGNEFIDNTILSIENKLNLIVKNNMKKIISYYLLPIDKFNNDKNKLSDKFSAFTTSYLDKFIQVKDAEDISKKAKNIYESYEKMIELIEDRKNKFNEFNKLLCNAELEIHKSENINKLKELVKKEQKNKEIKYANKLTGGGNDQIREIDTIPNNGIEGEYTNQCMWISIRDYLNRNNFNGRKNYTVKEIRGIASHNDTPINDENSDWNLHLHFVALENVMKDFDLQINIYPVDPDLGTINLDIFLPLGTGTNILNIAHYGAHFQYITEIKEPSKDYSTKKKEDIDFFKKLDGNIYGTLEQQKEEYEKFTKKIYEKKYKTYSMYLSEQSFRNEFIPNKIYENCGTHSYLYYIVSILEIIKQTVNNLNNLSISSFAISNIIYEHFINIISNLCLFNSYLLENKNSDFTDKIKKILEIPDIKNESKNLIINYFENINLYKDNIDKIYKIIVETIFKKIYEFIIENNKYQSLLYLENEFIKNDDKDEDKHKNIYSNNIEFKNFYENIPKNFNDYYHEYKEKYFEFIPYYYEYDYNIIYKYLKNPNETNISLTHYNITNYNLDKEINKFTLSVNNEYCKGYNKYLYDAFGYKKIDQKLVNIYPEGNCEKSSDTLMCIKTDKTLDLLINLLYNLDILVEKYINDIFVQKEKDINVINLLKEEINDKLLNKYEKEIYDEFIKKIENNNKNKKALIINNIIKIIKKTVEEYKNIEINNILKSLFKDNEKFIENIIDENKDKNMKEILNDNKFLDKIIEGNKERLKKYYNKRIIDKCYTESSFDKIIKLKENNKINFRIIDSNGNTILNRLVDQYNLYGLKGLHSVFNSLWTYKNNKNLDCKEYIFEKIKLITQKYDKKLLNSKFDEYGDRLENMINGENFQNVVFNNKKLTTERINKSIKCFTKYIYKTLDKPFKDKIIDDETKKIEDKTKKITDLLFNLKSIYDKLKEDNNVTNIYNLFKELEKIYNNYSDLDKYDDSSFNTIHYQILEIFKNEIIKKIAEEMKKLIEIDFNLNELNIEEIIKEILYISMVNKLELNNPDTEPKNIEILEIELVSNLAKDNMEQQLLLREIIKYYKIISDDICLHAYEQLKEILIDIKKIAILLQMIEALDNNIENEPKELDIEVDSSDCNSDASSSMTSSSSSADNTGPSSSSASSSSSSSPSFSSNSSSSSSPGHSGPSSSSASSSSSSSPSFSSNSSSSPGHSGPSSSSTSFSSSASSSASSSKPSSSSSSSPHYTGPSSSSTSSSSSASSSLMHLLVPPKTDSGLSSSRSPLSSSKKKISFSDEKNINLIPIEKTKTYKKFCKNIIMRLYKEKYNNINFKENMEIFDEFLFELINEYHLDVSEIYDCLIENKIITGDILSKNIYIPKYKVYGEETGIIYIKINITVDKQKYHISLLEIYYDLRKFRENFNKFQENVCKSISDSYNNYLKSNFLDIDERGFLGLYYVQFYKISDLNNYIKFKNDIFLKIFGNYKFKDDKSKDLIFKINEKFAISRYYFDDEWKPHITLGVMKEDNCKNRETIKEYNKNLKLPDEIQFDNNIDIIFNDKFRKFNKIKC